MKKKIKQRLGLIMLLLLITMVIIFFTIGADNILDTALGRTAAVTLIALWIISIVWQIVEAIIYFIKRK